MGFIHKNSEVSIKVLQYIGGKGSYIKSANTFSGHLKKIGMEDRSFNVEKIPGEAYKLTIKGKIDIRESDKLEINSEIFLVKSVKYSDGITFNTTKVLLVKS